MTDNPKDQEKDEFEYSDLPSALPRPALAARIPVLRPETPPIAEIPQKAAAAAAGAAAGPSVGRIETIPTPPYSPPPPIAEPVVRVAAETPAFKLEETKTEAPDVLAPPKEWNAATSVAILGGKGVGKTTMFLAMLERTNSVKKAGALTLFRPSVDLDKMPPNTRRMLQQYRRWEFGSEEKTQTNLDETQYYRMILTYRGGLLNRTQTINVDMVDTSGEALQGNHDGPIRRVWDAAYKDAQILIFCFPMWAAFPSGQLSEKDQRRRDEFIQGFGDLLSNYKQIRNQDIKVRVMLALTMADDNRSRLTTLRSKWIEPYFEGGQNSATLAGSNAGIVQYLANARRVSDYLRKEFEDSNNEVSEILSGLTKLKNVVGAPWIIPVTAFDSRRRDAPHADRSRDPIPAHVELPLLVAMCDRHNVLM